MIKKKTILITIAIVILTAGLATAGIYIAKKSAQPEEEIKEPTTEEPIHPLPNQTEQSKKPRREPPTQLPERTKPELGRTQVVIPPELDPDDVMAQFVPYMPPWGERITKGGHFWEGYFEIVHPQEGFIKGFGTSWHGEAHYVKKDGTKIKGPDDPYGFILHLYILKFTDSESAQEDYARISTNQKFRDFTLEGVRLKTKSGVPLPIKNEMSWMKLDPQQCQQYLLHSNNFIIYAFGMKEAAQDIIERAIEQFGS